MNFCIYVYNLLAYLGQKIRSYSVYFLPSSGYKHIVPTGIWIAKTPATIFVEIYLVSITITIVKIVYNWHKFHPKTANYGTFLSSWELL